MDDTQQFLDQPPAEIVFGIVSPVGTNLDVVRACIKDRLKTFGYSLKVKHLSQFFHRLKLKKLLVDSPEYNRIKTHMNAGNEVRENSGRNDFVALYAISDIGKERADGIASPEELLISLRDKIQNAVAADELNDSSLQQIVKLVEDNTPKPKPKQAWLLWSLKRPEEVEILRKVYREGFFLIGVFSPRDERKKNLIDKGMTKDQADKLIKRDEDEEKIEYGQRTRKTFHLADVFVDASDLTQMDEDLKRFLDLVFADPFTTPRVDEYAMFLAYAASLRSGDFSRQVGAVITSRPSSKQAGKSELDQGTIISVGANDVPAPGGGLYWPGGEDQRDHVKEMDSNEAEREEMLDEVLDKLKDDLKTTPMEAREKLKDCRVLDITEFGRSVHAEMEALLSAARSGVSPVGGTIYTTLFPCHNCAKHIVAAGIARVVYIEPYPKSQAETLHDDAITFEKAKGCDDKKVRFEPFVGVGPRRFFDLFSLTMGNGRVLVRKEKGARGKKKKWTPKEAELRVPLSPLSYLEREENAAGFIENLIKTEGKKDATKKEQG